MSPWDKAPRGSFTLLQTPLGRVFVTCWHVEQRVREFLRDDPGAHLVGFLVVPPKPPLKTFLVGLRPFELVCWDINSDLAVYQRRNDTQDYGEHVFLDYPSACCTDLRKGELVTLVGYPGEFTTIGQEVGDFGTNMIGLHVDNVTEERVTLVNESGHWDVNNFVDPPPSRPNLGGMSGCPAFVIRSGRYLLAGIMTEAGFNDSVIYLARLPPLRPNGMFDMKHWAGTDHSK